MLKFTVGCDLVFLTMIIIFLCISVCSTSTAVQAQIVFKDDEELLPYSDGDRGNNKNGNNPKHQASANSQDKEVVGSGEISDPSQDDVGHYIFL